MEEPKLFILEFSTEQPQSVERIRKGLQGFSSPESEEGVILPLADILTTLHGKRLVH